jgi:SAM-dependent methyltransferase
MVYADNSEPVDYASDSIYACSSTYDGQPDHYRRIVRHLLECGVSTQDSVLDVGCALGGLMTTLRECGFNDVRGISLSPAEVSACVSRGLRAEVADVSQAEAKTVTVSHVLEHVSDVPRFLSSLRGERIYIEVPDALGYVKHFTSLCQGFNSEHINHFDLSHLMLACFNAGMKIESQGAYNIPVGEGNHYPVIWVLASRLSPLSAAVSEYADRLDGQFRAVKERLACLPEKYAVWGVGQTTQILVAGGIIKPEHVWSATDTNPVYHNRVVAGMYVRTTEEFDPFPQDPILVCSQTSQASIVERIRQLGFANPIITLEER